MSIFFSQHSSFYEQLHFHAQMSCMKEVFYDLAARSIFSPVIMSLSQSFSSERVCIKKIFFLFLSQNICCGYSKEPSQRDSSFEHPKQTRQFF